MISTPNYLVTWARYRRQARLSHPHSLLLHKPTNLHELLFHLQVVSLLALSRLLSQTTFSPSPQTQTLLEDLQVKDLSTMVSSDYLDFLYSLSKESRGDQFYHRGQAQIAMFSIVSKVTSWRNCENESSEISFLNMLGEICGVLERSGKNNGKSLLKDWWSVKQWRGSSISDCLLEMMLAWTSKGDECSDSLLQLLDLFGRWFNHVSTLLTDTQAINHEVISSLTVQTKQMVKISQMKGKKASKQYLFAIKSSLLSSTELRPEVFAVLFSLLDTAAIQSETVLFDNTDLLKNEQLYLYLFYLQKTGQLRCFVSFHAFMRMNSVMAVLRIYQCLTAEMLGHQLSKQKDVDQLIKEKNLDVLNMFNIKPLSTSKRILQHYLHLSGIFISNPKKAAKQRTIYKYFKPDVPDPLQFMLIRRQCWQDRFGYEALGLSLWIVCDAYCKEVKARTKDLPVKQVGEYLKKLKIGICLFLLGLKYPVKMLQFLPLEEDLAWDLSVVPIIPGLLLDCGYFFKEFQREQLIFRDRLDFGAEGEVLPWAGSVTALKHIPFILHNHRGYEFFKAVLSISSQSNFQIYSEVIVSSLGSALKNLGISPESSEIDRRLALSKVSSEIRQQIIKLLNAACASGEKTEESAKTLMSLLS